MKGSEFNVVEQNAAVTHEFFLFSELLLFLESISDFESPFLPGFGSFENINRRAHGNKKRKQPFISYLIHEPVF